MLVVDVSLEAALEVVRLDDRVLVENGLNAAYPVLGCR